MNHLLHRSQNFCVILCSIFLLTNCQKESGFGGKASIRGTLIQRNFNGDFNVLQFQTPATDDDIYIEFGNDAFVADNIKTSASGDFEFRNLLPGKYKIYYYSDDSSRQVTNIKIPVVKEITISKSDRIVNIGTLIKYKTLKYDEGTSSIHGLIMMKYYINNFSSVREISPAQDDDVYIISNNHNYYDDRIRTLYDGTFTFPNLIKGHYTIYVYSDNPNGTSEKLKEIREVDITGDNQSVDVGTIYVNNK